MSQDVNMQRAILASIQVFGSLAPALSRSHAPPFPLSHRARHTDDAHTRSHTTHSDVSPCSSATFPPCFKSGVCVSACFCLRMCRFSSARNKRETTREVARMYMYYICMFSCLYICHLVTRDTHTCVCVSVCVFVCVHVCVCV